MKKLESEIWLQGEGDAWYERNISYLGKKRDMVLLLLELYNVIPKTVVEIGCANGYRLASMHDKYGCKVVGIEPSVKAIEDGLSKWPFIRFIKGMAESFELKAKVDLVIVNFVFHWIERNQLIKSIAKIDEILREGGLLVLGDFGTTNYLKRKYHHLPNEDVFTYKQNYPNIFISTGLFTEIAKLTFNHDTGTLSANVDQTNAAIVSLMIKDDVYIKSK